jgi:hypothetical protein
MNRCRETGREEGEKRERGTRGQRLTELERAETGLLESPTDERENNDES